MTRLRRWLATARRTAPYLCAAGWLGAGYVPYEHIASRLSRRTPLAEQLPDDRERLALDLAISELEDQLRAAGGTAGEPR
jgi:hypothetical protein